MNAVRKRIKLNKPLTTKDGSQIGFVMPMMLIDKQKAVVEAYTKTLKKSEQLDLDEWSDKYRKLPKETSSEHGQWRTSRFPFLRKIMKCLSPSSRAKEPVVIKGAQLGFTELAINWMLYCADHDPGPMMYIQKTKDAAEDFSTQKFVPNIEICKKVSKTLGKMKPKHLSNTTFNKGFPGGYVVLGGSNSGAFLRSKSISRATADEEDSFEKDCDGEGSPIFMVRKRLANFPDSKFFRLSTPKIEETSSIEPAYKKGSQEQYYMPCPHCNPEADKGGTMFVFNWNNIVWDKDEDGAPVMDADGVPTGIGHACPECGVVIKEKHKTWMMHEDNADWMSIKDNDPNDHDARPYVVGDVEFPSFQISSLYSPDGFFSWRDAVIEWFDYVDSGDKTLLQGFINQTLGQSYSISGSDVSHTALYNRREEYDPDGLGVEVPYNALYLTAGVDIQADRIEVETVGWGVLEESYGVDFAVLMGRVDTFGDHEGKDEEGNYTAWHLLDEYLWKKFRHASGQDLSIECSFVDSGYMAHMVHVFCRNREARHIYPVKGEDGFGKGSLIRPTARHKDHRTWHFKALVDELKVDTYAKLRVDTHGTGFCHYPIKACYSEKYFKGLTLERLTTVTTNGKKRLKWVNPPHGRNEPLDCRNYAKAAKLSYVINIERRIEKLHGAEAGEGYVVRGAGADTPLVAPKPRAKRKRGRVHSKGVS